MSLSSRPHLAGPQHRIEAARLLKIIGLEQIQAQGLEKLTFNLLMKKTHSEPFLVRRRFQSHLLSLFEDLLGLAPHILSPKVPPLL